MVIQGILSDIMSNESNHLSIDEVQYVLGLTYKLGWIKVLPQRTLDLSKLRLLFYFILKVMFLF